MYKYLSPPRKQVGVAMAATAMSARKREREREREKKSERERERERAQVAARAMGAREKCPKIKSHFFLPKQVSAVRAAAAMPASGKAKCK